GRSRSSGRNVRRQPPGGGGQRRAEPRRHGADRQIVADARPIHRKKNPLRRNRRRPGFAGSGQGVGLQDRLKIFSKGAVVRATFVLSWALVLALYGGHRVFAQEKIRIAYVGPSLSN